MIDLFLLLAIPFYSGVLGADTCLLIPFSMQTLLNSWKMNSPPLFDLKNFNLFPISFSTLAKYYLNFSNASDFSLRYITIVILE